MDRREEKRMSLEVRRVKKWVPVVPKLSASRRRFRHSGTIVDVFFGGGECGGYFQNGMAAIVTIMAGWDVWF